jgi:CheY-like chemotaxis protein
MDAAMAKILIIDDDPDMVLANRMCLEGAGYQVISANNPTDGLTLAQAEKPDLIVLDVMMDTATAGFQLALQLRGAEKSDQAKPHIPILMLTAIHSTTPLRFGPDEDFLPVDAFMDKPIDPEKFLAMVKELLSTKR